MRAMTEKHYSGILGVELGSVQCLSHWARTTMLVGGREVKDGNGYVIKR